MDLQAQIAAAPFWQRAALPALPEHEMPARVDALVVGAGYTGLSAARQIALAGRRVLVVEAGALGAGCSGRNGGQVAYSIKPTFGALSARHGKEVAYGICKEGLEAVAHVRALAAEDEVGFDWRERGCFVGAHTPRHFAAMAREAENQPRGLEQRISVIARADQHQELASDFYHGGLVYHEDASVDPMRFLIVLSRRALAAGASIVEHCRATAIQRARDGFEVATTRGVVRADKVLVATNGYSGPLSPWLRRRVIPIGSYQIATEPLGIGRVRELIPQARNIADSRRVVVYYRPSPDGTRIIFGGRAALAEKNPLACVPRLRSMLTQVFPQLDDVKISNAWVGWVAYTFDTLPHLGQRNGIYHCMGYCGQGVPMAPYLGMRIGQQMADLPAGRTAFDGLAFPSRPYYFGVPWFLAPSVLAYRTLDALGF